MPDTPMPDAPTLPATTDGSDSEPPPVAVGSWRQGSATQIAAALAVIVPLLSLFTWFYVLRDGPVTMNQLLLGPLVGGGSFIVWLLFLHLGVCGDRLESLGWRTGRWWANVLIGILLAAGFLLLATFQDVLRRLFPSMPLAPELVELLRGLAGDPWLLALWLGPVVWIGVAFFEELLRVFLLRRLWRVWGGRPGRWLAVLAVAAIFGLVHLYQGPAAAMFIAVKSFLAGWFFMATGRFWALVVAHALYDSAGILLALQALRLGML